MIIYHSGDVDGLKTKAQLIQKVEEEMIKKDYTTALEACYRALSTFDLDRMFEFDIVNTELSCLLRNLSDCHLHLGDIQAAINAAGDSVKYNQTCYKVSKFEYLADGYISLLHFSKLLPLFDTLICKYL